MYIILLLLFCLAGIIYLVSPKKFVFFLYSLKFEAIYWTLGLRATIEDYVYRPWAKIELSSRSGDVAVITGGARGVGAAVVSKLLQCGMHVVIGCRNVEAGEKLIHSLRSSGVKNGTTNVLHLDVGSFSSIQKFAQEVLQKCSKINILINNAGIMPVNFSITEDGHESHFMVNYLGHCLLTHLLLPKLKISAKEHGVKSRIVNVSSSAHEAGDIHFQDLTLREMYIPNAAYAQSKLAQILFTKALSRKLQDESSPVLVYAVHPGIVNTEIFDNTIFKRIFPWAPSLFFKTAEQGAIPVVYAAISTDVEDQSGAYISNCRVTRCSSVADSLENQEKLWDCMLSFLNVQDYGFPK